MRVSRIDQYSESGMAERHPCLTCVASCLSTSRRQHQEMFDLTAQRARMTNLFTFLKAYIDLRYPPVRDIKGQFRTLWLNDLPPHPCVQLFRDGETVRDGSEDTEVLLRIKRPQLTACPVRLAALAEWLKPGWKEFPGLVETMESRNVAKAGATQIERFEDDPRLAEQLRKWKADRERWLANERPAREALSLFETVYEWFAESAHRRGRPPRQAT